MVKCYPRNSFEFHLDLLIEYDIKEKLAGLMDMEERHLPVKRGCKMHGKIVSLAVHALFIYLHCVFDIYLFLSTE